MDVSSKHDAEYNIRAGCMGLCIVLSNISFDMISNGHRLKIRHGGETDEQLIIKLFSKIGFITRLYRDRTAQDMVEILQNVSMQDVKADHCAIVICVLSHGTARSGIFGIDGASVQLWSDLLQNFSNNLCPSLIGKPKLVILHTCRADGSETPLNYLNWKSPEPDWLIAELSPRGFLSLRCRSNGSPSVRIFYETVSQHFDSLNIIEILDLIQNKLNMLQVSVEIWSDGNLCRKICNLELVIVNSTTKKWFLLDSNSTQPTKFNQQKNNSIKSPKRIVSQISEQASNANSKSPCIFTNDFKDQEKILNNLENVEMMESEVNEKLISNFGPHPQPTITTSVQDCGEVTVLPNWITACYSESKFGKLILAAGSYTSCINTSCCPEIMVHIRERNNTWTSERHRIVHKPLAEKHAVRIVALNQVAVLLQIQTIFKSETGAFADPNVEQIGRLIAMSIEERGRVLGETNNMSISTDICSHLDLTDDIVWLSKKTESCVIRFTFPQLLEWRRRNPVWRHSAVRFPWTVSSCEKYFAVEDYWRSICVFQRDDDQTLLFKLNALPWSFVLLSNELLVSQWRASLACWNFLFDGENENKPLSFFSNGGPTCIFDDRQQTSLFSCNNVCDRLIGRLMLGHAGNQSVVIEHYEMAIYKTSDASKLARRTVIYSTNLLLHRLKQNQTNQMQMKTNMIRRSKLLFFNIPPNNF